MLVCGQAVGDDIDDLLGTWRHGAVLCRTGTA